PDGAFDDEQRCVGGMPPALRNNRTPPTGEIPASTAACSLERPTAIEAQNCRRFSRQARFHNFIATSLAKVLRRPVESALDRPVKPGDDSEFVEALVIARSDSDEAIHASTCGAMDC